MAKWLCGDGRLNKTIHVQVSRGRTEVLFLFGLLLALTGGCGPIWYLDAGFAERLAKQKHKPLLFYFKAWDSTQHRNMKLKVFEHPQIKKALVDTVNVELEFAFFSDYARRYGVRQPQVCVMCKPNGEKVSTPMYVNPVPTEKAFLDWLLKTKAAATPTPASAPAGSKPTGTAPTAARNNTSGRKPESPSAGNPQPK
jgi:hypothetical protein